MSITKTEGMREVRRCKAQSPEAQRYKKQATLDVNYPSRCITFLQRLFDTSEHAYGLFASPRLLPFINCKSLKSPIFCMLRKSTQARQTEMTRRRKQAYTSVPVLPHSQRQDLHRHHSLTFPSIYVRLRIDFWVFFFELLCCLLLRQIR